IDDVSNYGMGLKNIITRMNVIKGSVDFISNGNGTTIKLIFND
ncbi:MAG: hypothetical protein RLZZ546_1183, partial [Bacteroidota bacterium]